MQKNGIYVKVNGKEYKYTNDMKFGPSIISQNESDRDSSFKDRRGTGVFSRPVTRSEIEEQCRYETHVIFDGEEFTFFREVNGGYEVSAYDKTFASKHNFKPGMEPGEWIGWVSAKDVQLKTTRKPMQKPCSYDDMVSDVLKKLF